MTDANRFKITNGILAFTVVNTAASGYSSAWQAPGGKEVNAVSVVDYVNATAQWSCQVSEATLDASADTTTETVDPTWCAPGQTVPNPGQTSWTLNGTYFQDSADTTGLWGFLYENDTKEAYFYMGLGGASKPPAATGRCRIIASTFGGPGSTSLTSTLACPVSRRFDAWTGTATPGKVITWDGHTAAVPPAATGATAGIPGSFTPSGCVTPANLAALTGITASPATAWTTGQYVATADTIHQHWSGSAWVTGNA